MSQINSQEEIQSNLQPTSNIITNDDNEEYDGYEEYNDSKYLTLRCKGLYDDCTSIDEMIKSLENQITELKKLKEEKWIVECKVYDDYAILYNNDI